MNNQQLKSLIDIESQARITATNDLHTRMNSLASSIAALRVEIDALDDRLNQNMATTITLQGERGAV